MKKYLALFLCLTVISGISIPAQASGITATPTTSGIAIDGSNIYCAAYTINGNNYFKLRDLAAHLDFGVTWDSAVNTIRIDTSKSYVPDGSETKTPATESAAAIPTTSKVTLDGMPVDWTSYSIGGNNYFRLRDVMKALDIFVFFSAEFNIVGIITDRRYEDEQPRTQTSSPPLTAPTAEVIADGSGRLSDTPITKKVLDGSDMAREDFSRLANPAVFDELYTRAAYNAIRQTILDKDIILSGSNDKGFNPYYHYAHVIATPESRAALVPMLISIRGHYNVSTSAEPYLGNYYLYPNYLVFSPQIAPLWDAAEINVANTIEQTRWLSSDAGRVRFLNNALCDRMEYDVSSSSGINVAFSSISKVKGECSSFAGAFSYLCDRAGIPCIIISGENHAWNTVYVDGKWLYVDVSANAKVEGRDSLLLSPTSRKTDEHPKSTAFAKELLVPSSSTK